MIEIDGAAGEGGGQIVRTALALSLVTGKPFRIENVRARRAKPGLRRQHLTAVEAAAKVGRAHVEGAALGSLSFRFEPAQAIPGSYSFAIGTAGSTTLVLQTVLPALLCAPGRSFLTLEGGTHNPLAPPFDFLQKAFLPLIESMGPRVVATLERPGFVPAGGGRFSVEIEPAPKLRPLKLLERGEVRRRRAIALVSGLPASIGERELRVVERELGWAKDELQLEEIENPRGPGNVLSLEIASEHVTEVFTGFGERGVPAERVAARAVAEARRYLAAGVPIGEHLADQLVIPVALAGGGRFRTLRPSSHLTTQIETVRRFIDLPIAVHQRAEDVFEVVAA
ncbi:MAG: RNA 3'-terminal phosphate cyclase [Myxococcales bacterium]